MSLNPDKFRLRLAAAVAVLVFICFSLFQNRHQTNPQISSHLPGRVTDSTPTVAKISVVYGELNENYINAIESHERHAARHGYPQLVLRNILVDGYWNKILYILQILVQELGKNAADRAQWLMWFDADSIILNPEIPVEIFLPPSDFNDVHFLATKDQNGLNTGIFFIRVHRWSIDMLVRVLGFPVYKPNLDLGWQPDQMTMGIVFNETDFAPHVVYQPRRWYNTYQFREGFEGKPGDMLVHFPGLEELRAPKMKSWFEILNDEVASKQYIVPLERTDYKERVNRFWDTMREGRAMIQVMEDYLRTHQDYGQKAHEELERLRFAVQQESDRPMAMEAAIERMQILFAEDMKPGKVNAAASAAHPVMDLGFENAEEKSSRSEH